MKTPTDRLIELHARDGCAPKELASSTCPQCGERPILFAHPSFPPLVDCICCAPFVLHPKFGLNEQWGMFVEDYDVKGNSKQWGKLALSCDEDEEE